MTNRALVGALEAAVPGGVFAHIFDRTSMASDASHYALIPEVVVRPKHAGHVGQLFRVSHEMNIALTFRSGGTSLSGQGVSSGLLVDVRRHFKEIEVLNDGARIRLQPGSTVKQANLALMKYGHKLGPDPASEIACTIGGVVANNSSGMACGTKFNTYATLDSMIFVLPSGTVVDTRRPDADDELRSKEPELYEGLAGLQKRIHATSESVEKIRQMYAIKNTMGYSLNSFVDYKRPVDILQHLIVGSEGTLAFIAEVTFNTVPLLQKQATGLLIFETLEAATDSLLALKESRANVIELLDASSLRVAQREHMADSVLVHHTFVDHAALLVEYQAASVAELESLMESGQRTFAKLPIAPTVLTQELKTRNELWKARKGLYAAVAGNRPSGTTAILEDIAVPSWALHETTKELAELLRKHKYFDSVIFGHAKDGNLHFLLNERFDIPEMLERYRNFTEEMVTLVLSNNGSLKAEHGTGRIMAPYVRRQFGDELYEVMVEIKRLCDPRNVLNPGVLINSDPEIYVQDLKTSPTIDVEVDRCVECGYCEPVCPSRDLTLTPRQRIVIRRAISEAESAGDDALVKDLSGRFDYDVVQTCAADSMCAVNCPVHIDTGALVKRLRAEEHGAIANKIGAITASNWAPITSLVGKTLSLAQKLPATLITPLNKVARNVMGADAVPLWNKFLPGGGVRREAIINPAADVIFFPSCLNTMFASSDEGLGAQGAFLSLCKRAGIAVAVPENISELCCGTPWISKGLTAGYETMGKRTASALAKLAVDQKLPVVCDSTSCTYGLNELKMTGTADLKFEDALEYVATHVLPKLKIFKKLESITLHPTCSGMQLGLNEAMAKIASAVADTVVTPENWACCGYAGDRGMLHPELTASATKFESQEVRANKTSKYASSNRPCEIAMSNATGETYVHLLEVLEEVTR
ncbi:MAG: FAD-binding oxidoreductase [Actinobacteria bacterium]|nr:FAD-binding oxidoreductase [Actinomycetota bacterium]